MAEVRILQYRAIWDVVDHRGTIEVLPEGAGALLKQLKFTDAAEFGALANLLQLDGDIWLVDDRLISTRPQPTGLYTGE